MPRITMTREQLYEQVWSQPMMRLATSFGLSDVGLAKLCKRHNVPRPPRGYWAKLEAGQKPRKIPLPELEDESNVIIYRPDRLHSANSGLATEVLEMVEQETSQVSKITVSDNLRGAHKLVTAARDELEQAKKMDSGLLERPDQPALDISVSKDQLRRTLLIYDALLKDIERRGYKVTRGPCVTILEQQVSFGIKETVKIVKEQPEEHDLSGRYEFGFNRYLSKRVPNGQLTLFLPDAERYWASGCRRQWRDASKQRLEDVLDKVVTGLIAVAARKRQHEIDAEQRRLAEEEAARKREEIARQRAELKAKQDAESERLEELLRQAESLQKSRKIRRLVQAVQSANPDGTLDQWAQWALLHADRFDPTIKSPPCILDEPLPEDPRRW